MDTSLLATKLFVPPARPGIVARPRLMERLRDALSCSLVLVSAPAGSGKTTLVSDWTRETNKHCRCAWVSLDEGDNDPVRFWDYFIAAVKTLQPSAGENALTLLHSPQPYPTEAMLTSLINDLTNAVNDFAIVLDDYHLIKAEPIQAAIAFLLEHLPPKMHLVIATRTDPALPLPHLRGRGTMLEIGAGDLRFTVPETAGLFKEMQNLELSAEDISALNDRTEGWAVGLTMAAISLSKQKDIPGFIASFTGSQRYVMDYLVEEVLKGQSDEMQDFFLKTCVLERLAPPLCDCLTGRSGSQEMLVRLEQANLFLIPLDESRQWYRYHHLFAELLCHQLEAKYGAAEATALHQRASQWYEDNGFPDDAIHHALATKDWERAVKLIGNIAEDRIKRGENMTLLNWLQSIPDEALHTNFNVYGQYARILVFTGQLDVAEPILRYLEQTAQGDANLQGEVAVLQADSAQRRGDILRAIELGERALSLLPPDNLAYRSTASNVLAIVHIDRGSYDEAWSRCTDAYEMARKTGDYLVVLTALAYRGYILSVQGKLQAAEETFQQAINMAEWSPAVALVRQCLAIVLYELNDLAAAAYQLHLAVELNEIRGNPDSQTYCYTFLARTQQAQEETTLSLETIAKADKLIGSRAVRPGVRAWTIALHGLLALRQDDSAVTLKWSRRISECADELPFAFRHVPARLLAERGEKVIAAKQLQDYYQKAFQVGAHSPVIQTRVYQALVAATPTEALDFLSEALVNGEPEGFIRTFVDEGKLLKPLLRKALSQGITPEYTAKLLGIIEKEELQRKATKTGQGNPSQSPLAKGRGGTLLQTALMSQRELEVLRLVAEGLSNQQIADKLTISLNTAKTHVSHIFDKLGAKDRLQAVTRARELKLI